MPNSMSPHVVTLRAIVSEFISRILTPVQWATLIVWAALFALSVWLILNVNPWWWLPLIAVTALGLITGAIILVVRTIIATIRPRTNLEQRRHVRELVDALLGATETIGTPRAFIVGRILYDVVRRRNFAYLQSLLDDSVKLRQLYSDTVRSFKQ